MPKVAKALFLVVLTGLIFMLSVPAFAQNDPQGTPDSIYINPVPFMPDSVIFEIRLNTDNTGLNQIAGIGMPFLVSVSNGALISLDTTVATTFQGSVCSGWIIKSTGTDAGGPNPTVSPVQFVIGAVDFGGGITAGNNLLLARIKLNVNGALLDTITIDSMSTVTTSLNFSTAGAVDFTPRWYPTPYIWTNAVKDRPIGEKSALPTNYDLGQNFPNPFNANTQIQFALPKSGHVKLEVFNVLGQKVKTLVDEELTAGYKQVTWDGTDQRGDQVSSGIYFYRVRMGSQYTEMRKMVMIK